eukprot:Gb_39342 [translate_table: standard]
MFTPTAGEPKMTTTWVYINHSSPPASEMQVTPNSSDFMLRWPSNNLLWIRPGLDLPPFGTVKSQVNARLAHKRSLGKEGVQVALPLKISILRELLGLLTGKNRKLKLGNSRRLNAWVSCILGLVEMQAPSGGFRIASGLDGHASPSLGYNLVELQISVWYTGDESPVSLMKLQAFTWHLLEQECPIISGKLPLLPSKAHPGEESTWRKIVTFIPKYDPQH